MYNLDISATYFTYGILYIWDIQLTFEFSLIETEAVRVFKMECKREKLWQLFHGQK